MSAFSEKFTKLDFGWGSSSDPAGVAYCNAKPDPLTEFKWALLLGRGEEGIGTEGKE